jgi:hypothetical protein
VEILSEHCNQSSCPVIKIKRQSYQKFHEHSAKYSSRAEDHEDIVPDIKPRTDGPIQPFQQYSIENVVFCDVTLCSQLLTLVHRSRIIPP